VFILGFTGILGKLISLSAESLVFYRLALTVPALWLVMMVMKIPFTISKQQFRQYMWVGMSLGVHWICFFSAIKFSNVAVALSCLATGSMFASFLEPLYQRQKIKWFDVIISLIVFVVLAYILGLDMSYGLGALLGIAAAFFAAWNNVLNKTLAGKAHSITISFYEIVGAMIPVVIFLAFTTSGFTEFPLPRMLGETGRFWTDLAQSDWLWLVILAWICTAYPFTAMVELMKKLSAFSVTFAVNFEPIYSIILAYLIFGESEKMKPEFYVGVLIIFVLILFYPVLKSKLFRTFAQKHHEKHPSLSQRINEKQH
jgi:drug/metabolite transporter (DMT)-like permease